MQELKVFFRPKTGFNYGTMKCELYDDKFVLTMKREALIDFVAGKTYEIPYSAIDKVENASGGWGIVPGVRIYLNDTSIAYPSSPSRLPGGLISSISSYMRKDKFIIYFDKSADYDIFLKAIGKTIS